MDMEITIKLIKNNIHLLIKVLLGIFLFTVNASGQIESVVTVSAEVEPKVLRAGEVLTVKTTASITPKFHIYAINKKSEGPIASKVIIDGGDVIESVGITWEPNPITKFDEGFQTETHFHEGRVTFETPVKLASTLQPGNYSIQVGLLYQACDPSICYPPKTVTLPLSFVVEGSQVQLKEIENQFSDVFPSTNTSASKVNISTLLSVDKVHPGTQFQSAVVLDIRDRWHVNAHVPSFDYLIGTELNLILPKGVRVIDIRYPESKKVKFDFAEDALDVYEGHSPIFIVLKITKGISMGEGLIKGKLRVQACDDQVCLAPSTIDVVIPFEVVGLNQSVFPINTQLFSSVSGQTGGISGSSTQLTQDNEIAAVFEREGALLAFLGIFFIGLALNLTPCVYPMLSVTVSLFGGQTDTNTFRVFLKAVIYVLGIASMYSVLGVAAALGGGLFGGIMQSPWVLSGIGLLLFGLALSMFGLYELRMPYWLTSKIGGTNTTGIIGIYLSGLIVGVFAAPCIGPPIIALLAYVGTKGDPVFGFWAFFILSLGLGSPYLILGTFAGLLKKVPKSGIWMVWVKKVFGVVLIGVALFYVGLAFFPKLTAYVVPITLILGGIYLGILQQSAKERRTFRRVQWTVGIVALVFGLISLRGLQKEGMDWEPYSPQKLEEARIASKPLIMDFYADWCIPCLELDRLTFTDSKVLKATEDFVKLKVDLTHYDAPAVEELRKKFNISGVPTIVFLGPDGNEVLGTRVVGYLPPEEFLERMKPLIEVSSL